MPEHISPLVQVVYGDKPSGALNVATRPGRGGGRRTDPGSVRTRLVKVSPSLLLVGQRPLRRAVDGDAVDPSSHHHDRQPQVGHCPKVKKFYATLGRFDETMLIV
jgi:hypothetical protein